MSDIKDTIDLSAREAQYDQNAKELLAFEMVLANILVHATREFSGMDPREVAELIEGKPSVGTVPMNPGFTNEEGPDGTVRITGDNNESRARYESVTYYDIFFHVRTADGLSKVYINIEMQKDEPTVYDVEMRGIFYSVREISSQMGRDFSGKNYNDICPVYSIWLVMNAGGDALERIHLAKEDIVGVSRWNDRYDILNVVIARFGDRLQEDREKKLHRLVGALFLPEVPIETKEEVLENEFGIPISTKEREDVTDMSNLGEGIYEMGVRKGISQGISQGRLEEIMDSIAEGYYDLETGARKSGLTVQELEAKMREAERIVPV